MTSQLLLTLDGIRYDQEELTLDELGSIDQILDRVSITLAMFVIRASGLQVERSNSEGWKRRPQLLPSRGCGPGYLSTQCTLRPSSGIRTDIEAYGNRAFELLFESLGNRDMAGNVAVQDYLDEISDALPEGVLLWLGDSDNPNRIGIRHTADAVDDVESHDEALIEDLHAIGLRSAALLGPGPSAVEHGDLLYDDRGLPK